MNHPRRHFKVYPNDKSCGLAPTQVIYRIRAGSRLVEEGPFFFRVVTTIRRLPTGGIKVSRHLDSVYYTVGTYVGPTNSLCA